MDFILCRIKMDNMRWGEVNLLLFSQSVGEQSVDRRKRRGQSCGILRPSTDTDPLGTDEAVAAPRVVSAERRANSSQA